MKPDDFYSRQGVRYQAGGVRGFLSVKVLPFLNGRPWDDIALGYVHSLRPSMIRVIRDEETMDAQTWRVSVYVYDGNIIESIRQEVEVWLPDGIGCGADLRQALELKKD